MPSRKIACSLLAGRKHFLSNIHFSHFSILPNPGAQAPFAKILPNINVELFECPHSKRDYRANVQRKSSGRPLRRR